MLLTNGHLLGMMACLVGVQLGVTQDLRRLPTKTCEAYCLLVESGLDMRFHCDMGDDTQGLWVGIDSSGNEVTCSYDYSSYPYFSMTSSVSDGTGSDVNLCGMGTARAQSNIVYTWRLQYLEQPNAEDISAGKDRVYVVDCTVDNTVNTKVSTSLRVVIDDEREIVPERPEVELNIRVRNTNSLQTFHDLGVNEVVEVTNYIQLELQQTLQSSSVLNPTCLTGYSCSVSGTSDFANAIEILGLDGCPSISDVDGLRKVVAPATGFEQFDLNPDTSCRSRTGSIEVHQLGRSDEHYYMCRFKFCFPGDESCSDICAFNTQGKRRRRRQADNEYVVTSSMRIRSSDGKEPVSKGTEHGTLKYTIIGLSVGVGTAAIVLAVVGGLCVMTFRRRRLAMKAENIKQVYANGVSHKS